jgi:hypothetical protein
MPGPLKYKEGTSPLHLTVPYISLTGAGNRLFECQFDIAVSVTEIS